MAQISHHEYAISPPFIASVLAQSDHSLKLPINLLQAGRNRRTTERIVNSGFSIDNWGEVLSSGFRVSGFSLP